MDILLGISVIFKDLSQMNGRKDNCKADYIDRTTPTLLHSTERNHQNNQF